MRTNGNRYSIGESVYHVGRKRSGRVFSIINRNDSEDIRQQGFRYCVQHSGWMWSVPESALRPVSSIKKAKSEPSDINYLESTNSPKTPQKLPQMEKPTECPAPKNEERPKDEGQIRKQTPIKSEEEFLKWLETPSPQTGVCNEDK